MTITEPVITMKSSMRMKQSSLAILVLVVLAGLRPMAICAGETVWLGSLDLSQMKQSFRRPVVDRNIVGQPLTLGGKIYERGLGAHADSLLSIDLGSGTERFQAVVGIDDQAKGLGSVKFLIMGDGKKLFDSGVMKRNDPARTIDLDLKGVRKLLLVVDSCGDGITFDNADWADARFLVSGAKPKTIELTGDEASHLTPKADSIPIEKAVIRTPRPGPAPRINGPLVTGCRPGHPFIYRIPATGRRPMRFAAQGLPPGLNLDPATGIITGKAPARGRYAVTLRATNNLDESVRRLEIVSGDTLALTPPMGWNDWYTHTRSITDQLMREAAEVMIASGMADVGYQYLSIDDCWMNVPANNNPRSSREKDPARFGPARDQRGNILANQYFPDMKGMTDYIHSQGLKAGIYTSPGPFTCAGYSGTYQHEEQDAKQFADWGFDFLKYDWCSYSQIAQIDPKDRSQSELEKRKAPYKLMGDILRQQERDIVFNLCQYGAASVWEWGAEVGGHCWRTAGDLGGHLRGIFEVALKNAEHRAWSKPGAWNDPDYLMIGCRGGTDKDGQPRRFALTPNESYAYMSLWCLMAAPLFYSGDMNKLDEFTLNVLCNPEVIAVDQDPLGISAEVQMLTEDTFLMIKPLEDGSRAVGLFNRGQVDTPVTATWAALGVSGRQIVRDLWEQKDLGERAGTYETTVPQRGVIMLRLRAAN